MVIRYKNNQGIQLYDNFGFLWRQWKASEWSEREYSGIYVQSGVRESKGVRKGKGEYRVGL